MALTTVAIDARVKVEGKDSNDQFGTERANFLRDTCIEITTSQDYYWLWETITLTVPAIVTDWFNIASNFHKVETVCYANTAQQSNKQFFTFVRETDVIDQYYQIYSGSADGRYRLRWNESTKAFQMALINGPAAGSSILVLVKKFYNTPESFPDFMEETLKQGTLARFLTMLEGDDLEYGKQIMDEYRTLGKEQEKLGNNEISHKTRRAKTNKELDENTRLNQYRST